MMVDLLRHGATGRAGYIDGRSDWPLTDAGWHQMQRQTAGRRWTAIVASPLRRAREPAERLLSAKASPCSTLCDLLHRRAVRSGAHQ